MTIREKLILWLLRILIGSSIHRKGRIEGSLKSEIKTCHHIAYESMIQSLVDRSAKAQLIFLHMYLRSLDPDVMDKVARYAMFISRNREEGYATADAVSAARSYPQRSAQWKKKYGPTNGPDVQPSRESLLRGAFSKDLDRNDRTSASDGSFDPSPSPDQIGS